MPSFDLAVIGAGAVGSAAAYAAARAGKRVVLFEQFAVGHNRGSSHGESRIIRHSYANAAYASLAPAAFHAWRQLETRSRQRLLTMTGGLDLGPADDPAMLACRDALTEAGIGFVWLEGDAAGEAYPQFNHREGGAVLWQSGAGILNASRCVAAMVADARGHGADVREHTRVLSVEPGPEVTIRFTSAAGEGAVTVAACVVAAGPWARRFFTELGLSTALTVTHQQVVYYPVLEPGPWRLGRCPVYIAHGRGGFYGFPEYERPGFIKVAVETEVAIDGPFSPPTSRWNGLYEKDGNPPSTVALRKLAPVQVVAVIGAAGFRINTGLPPVCQATLPIPPGMSGTTQSGNVATMMVVRIEPFSGEILSAFPI